MYFVLFGLWIVLNGKWTLEIGLVGLVVCAALYAFMCAFMGYSPKKEWQVVKRLPRIVGYVLYLVKEVYKAAFDTIRLIWAPEKEIQPRLITFRTKLKTDAAKVVLANSITMTPGTITVDVQDDVFLVHCLDDSFDLGAEGFEMENRVMRLEGTKAAAPAEPVEAVEAAEAAAITENEAVSSINNVQEDEAHV